MGKKILTFGDIEIEKNNFYDRKSSIFLKDIENEEVLVSNKIYFGKEKKKTIALYWLLV